MHAKAEKVLSNNVDISVSTETNITDATRSIVLIVQENQEKLDSKKGIFNVLAA